MSHASGTRYPMALVIGGALLTTSCYLGDREGEELTKCTEADCRWRSFGLGAYVDPSLDVSHRFEGTICSERTQDCVQSDLELVDPETYVAKVATLNMSLALQPPLSWTSSTFGAQGEWPFGEVQTGESFRIALTDRGDERVLVDRSLVVGEFYWQPDASACFNGRDIWCTMRSASSKEPADPRPCHPSDCADQPVIEIDLPISQDVVNLASSLTECDAGATSPVRVSACKGGNCREFLFYRSEPPGFFYCLPQDPASCLALEGPGFACYGHSDSGEPAILVRGYFPAAELVDGDTYAVVVEDREDGTVFAESHLTVDYRDVPPRRPCDSTNGVTCHIADVVGPRTTPSALPSPARRRAARMRSEHSAARSWLRPRTAIMAVMPTLPASAGSSPP